MRAARQEPPRTRVRRLFGAAWLLAALVAAGLVLPAAAAGPLRPDGAAKVVVGYYPSWNRAAFDHTRIDYARLTHIAHAFTKPDAEGNLIIPEDYVYPELVRSAHENGVKVIMSIGGWENCEGFPGMASRASTRKRFLDQVTDFCRQQAYDGIDIDWEFVSNAEEQKNFVLLIKELSVALKSLDPPRLLAMAAPASAYWCQWINFEELIPFFDYIGFMTYDFHGPWSEHSGHNAPLWSCAGDACGSVDETFRYARTRGVPLEKLLLGVPFYGRSFDCGGLGRPFQTSVYYPFDQVMAFQNAGWSYEWDDCAKVPYLLRPDGEEIISFDDFYSVFFKAVYVLQQQAAGLILWELSQDVYLGIPLLLRVIDFVFQCGR